MANAHRRRARKRISRDGRRSGEGRGGRSLLLAALGFAGIVAVVAAAALGGVAYSVYQSYADDLQPPDAVIRQSSAGGALILDRNGVPLYQFADPNQGLRQPVSIDKIAAPMLLATVSTEDASFYDNPGINVRGLLRAAAENFLPGGGDVGFLEGGGGSSITQQLVKNLYIDEEDRYRRGIDGVPRKIEETVIALELTRKYSKDQILEWYLNQIFYGNNSYGVEAASQRYFAKSAAALTLAEAAMLAGIPAAPTVYDPIGNYEAAKQRQINVLDLMARHDFISQDEADAAKAEPLAFATAEQARLLAPHWVFNLWNPESGEGVLLDMCLSGLIERPSDMTCRDLIERGGLRVVTTLDLTMQSMAESVLRDWIEQYEASSRGHNGALMSMDPRTGEVLVYVGSRDYNNPDILGKNDMIQALNSPGSSFKPIVYLTAFMRGWAPASTIWDTPVQITNPDGSVFAPANPNRDYKGPITVREALGSSLNVPAIKVAREVGIDAVIDQARLMGYTSFGEKSDFGPALATGGGDIRLADHVFAYSALANNGVQRGIPAYREDKPEWWPQLQPVMVLQVTDTDDRVLYKFEEPESVRVAPAAETYLISSILSDDVARSPTYGRGSSLNLPGRTAAVKTGTSEPFENSRAIGETWTIGYTPQLVTGVWIGNADNTPMVNISSATVAGRTWNEFMTAVHAALGLEPLEFERPADVVEADVVLPGPDCTRIGTDLFRQGSTPDDHSLPNADNLPRNDNEGGENGQPAEDGQPAGDAEPTEEPQPTATAAARAEPFAHPFCHEDEQGHLRVVVPEGEHFAEPEPEATPTPEPSATPVNPFSNTPTPEAPNPFAGTPEPGDHQDDNHQDGP